MTTITTDSGQQVTIDRDHDGHFTLYVYDSPVGEGEILASVGLTASQLEALCEVENYPAMTSVPVISWTSESAGGFDWLDPATSEDEQKARFYSECEMQNGGLTTLVRWQSVEVPTALISNTSETGRQAVSDWLDGREVADEILGTLHRSAIITPPTSVPLSEIAMLEEANCLAAEQEGSTT